MQVLDSELDRIGSRFQEIDRILSSSPDVEAARQEALLADRNLKAAHGALRDLEDQAASQRAKLEETTRRLYSGVVKNPKELLDLQSEENALRNHIASLEERQLEQMMAVDDSQAEADRARSRLKDVDAHRQIESASLTEERQELLLRQETLEAQREAGIAVVNAEDLQVYARVRTTHHGLAVARIEGGACGACGVAPSQAQIDQARPGDQIVFCGNCGRILYAG
jgi:predicted  nucleic acid-binding Zn-ribbon protein